MDPAALVADLVKALLDEEAARREVRATLGRQAALLGELRGLGLPATRVAHRVAATRGLVLSLSDRLRLAGRLRKRAQRATACRADLAGAHGQTDPAVSPSEWALTPDDNESIMAKLVKRTITEEYEEKDQERDEDETEEEAEDVEEELEKEPAPSKRHRRR